MKKLVLAEKPSVGREIAKVLHCSKMENGALVGDNYVVTWALGHLVTLALPEELNPSWANWRLEDLPIIPNKYETRVIKETSRQYSCVKNWLFNPIISELVIATDAGREGELVARWIVEKAGFKKPMSRLWISSLTEEAIREGFRKLAPASNYDHLAQSAKARAAADWVVGLNVTRALTCKFNAQLSAGRVQTPTLALIVSREEQIRHFVSVPFFTAHIKINQFDLCYEVNNQAFHFSKEESAQAFCRDLKKVQLKVDDVVSTNKQETPPMLYDLTSLQQVANNLYGFSAKKTLDIIQTLYEKYKYLTYPRTDSKVLTEDMVATARSRIVNLTRGSCGNKYKEYANQILLKPLDQSKRIFNNKGVSDHTAIIPTELIADLGILSLDEGRIYECVVKRFLEAFMAPHTYIQTKIICKYSKGAFVGVLTKDVNMGFKQLSKDLSNKQESILLKKNDSVSLDGLYLVKGATVAPSRYTQATLLNAMEHAGNFVEDSLEKSALSSSNGIGTPATRAEIIERIFSAGYVEERGNTIYPTKKGTQLIQLVPDLLKTPSLTATQEMHLQNISLGKESSSSFITSMEETAKELVVDVTKNQTAYLGDNVSSKVCPTCGKRLLEISNKSGKFFVCPDKSCGYRKQIFRITGLRCPNCHKQLKIMGEGESSYFSCSCGFKEKKTSFELKLKENKQSMNRHEMQNYIKKQQEDIPSNNPFAELLKNK